MVGPPERGLLHPFARIGGKSKSKEKHAGLRGCLRESMRGSTECRQYSRTLGSEVLDYYQLEGLVSCLIRGEMGGTPGLGCGAPSACKISQDSHDFRE